MPLFAGEGKLGRHPRPDALQCLCVGGGLAAERGSGAKDGRRRPGGIGIIAAMWVEGCQYKGKILRQGTLNEGETVSYTHLDSTASGPFW